MWRVAALAWMPINALIFGATIVVIAHVPGLTGDITVGGGTIFVAAFASVVAAMPPALWVAQRMVTPRDRDALGAPACDGTRPDCRCCHAHGRA